MKVLYLTAGAAGMYCGSCMHDNTLAAALTRAGCDIQLVPLYTPIRTDEEDVSVDRVFFGGINMYLQQKIPLFRHLPAFADRWLNNPKLIRRVAGGSVSVKAGELGAMTLSVLRAEHGNQRKEVRRLLDWIEEESQPDIINLTNLLVSGFVPLLKNELQVPVLVTLQGDDLFLDELEEPYRGQVIGEMRRLAESIDGFVVHSDYYAEKMGELLGISRARFHKIPLGIRIEEFAETKLPEKEGGDAPIVGYLARISPEKGFHVLVDAFIALRQMPGMAHCRLRAAGWLGEDDREFFDTHLAKLRDAGLESAFEYFGAIERDEKISFLQGLDVFSVPTTYREPKGIYVLEAMACGVPVVQPAHGIFPELLSATKGGKLFDPGDAGELAGAMAALLGDAAVGKALGREGRRNVLEKFAADVMAGRVLEVYGTVLRAGLKVKS